MDFFDETPSTSHLSPQPTQEDMQDEGLGTDQDSSLEQSSCDSGNHSKIDNISIRVQDMVAKINDCRANDQTVINGFQETLVEKVTGFCQQMKEHMFTVYEDNSCDMHAKLQELSEILERCRKLNDELLGASQALASLSQTLSQTPEQ